MSNYHFLVEFSQKNNAQWLKCCPERIHNLTFEFGGEAHESPRPQRTQKFEIVTHFSGVFQYND